MTLEDWSDPDRRLLAAEMRMASGTPAYAALPGAVFLVFNNGSDAVVRMPDPGPGGQWRRRLDTAQDRVPDRPAEPEEPIAGESVVAFLLGSSG